MNENRVKGKYGRPAYFVHEMAHKLKRLFVYLGN